MPRILYTILLLTQLLAILMVPSFASPFAQSPGSRTLARQADAETDPQFDRLTKIQLQNITSFPNYKIELQHYDNASCRTASWPYYRPQEASLPPYRTGSPSGTDRSLINSTYYEVKQNMAKYAQTPRLGAAVDYEAHQLLDIANSLAAMLNISDIASILEAGTGPVGSSAKFPHSGQAQVRQAILHEGLRPSSDAVNRSGVQSETQSNIVLSTIARSGGLGVAYALNETSEVKSVSDTASGLSLYRATPLFIGMVASLIIDWTSAHATNASADQWLALQAMLRGMFELAQWTRSGLVSTVNLKLGATAGVNPAAPGGGVSYAAQLAKTQLASAVGSAGFDAQDVIIDLGATNQDSSSAEPQDGIALDSTGKIVTSVEDLRSTLMGFLNGQLETGGGTGDAPGIVSSGQVTINIAMHLGQNAAQC